MPSWYTVCARLASSPTCIMDVNIFTEQKDCLELGVTEDDIKAAIFDSIKVSEDSYRGKVQLLDMKGE